MDQGKGKPTINTDVKSWVVLIVDDKLDNLTIAKMALAYHGAQVFTATNGEEGLEVLKTLQPTFILLDLAMPKMNGWEMFNHVRANAATAHIPVIALTAYAMEGDEEKVLAAGFDGYIAKPFNVTNLVGQIQASLKQIAKPN